MYLGTVVQFLMGGDSGVLVPKAESVNVDVSVPFAKSIDSVTLYVVS